MTNNNYILARWRDAHTDPPPHGWIGLNTIASGARYYGACGYMPGDQWLDITDVPAVPRAQVQAAVDELHAEAARRDVRVHGYGCNDDLIYVLDVLREKTGVMPTEEES